jgi:hypothetical protein
LAAAYPLSAKPVQWHAVSEFEAGIHGITDGQSEKLAGEVRADSSG